MPVSAPEAFDAPEYCAVCGDPITRATEPAGVIYTRLQVDGHWFSAPVCTADFMRGRSVIDPPPARVVWDAFAG